MLLLFPWRARLPRPMLWSVPLVRPPLSRDLACTVGATLVRLSHCALTHRGSLELCHNSPFSSCPQLPATHCSRTGTLVPSATADCQVSATFTPSGLVSKDCPPPYHLLNLCDCHLSILHATPGAICVVVVAGSTIASPFACLDVSACLHSLRTSVVLSFPRTVHLWKARSMFRLCLLSVSVRGSRHVQTL